MVGTRVASVPAHAEPGGLVQKGVALATLQLVSNLFPAQTCGRGFFAQFFERAAVEQSVIADVAKDTVYICTQSIATLGKELGLPNETTHKYVKLYMALGLLRKQKFMGKLAFLLFTGIYHPPQTLESDLDFLIGHSRPKLRTMARDVKARCKLYGLISQDLITALEHLNALLQQKGGSKRALEQQVAQAQALASTMLRHAATRSLPPPDSHWQNDAQTQHTPASPRHKLENESTHHGSTERRLVPSAAPNLPGSAHLVDSSASRAAHESPQAAIQARFEQEIPTENLPAIAKMVDSVQPHQAEESSHTPIQRRFEGEKPCSRLPELPCEVDSTAGNPDTSPVESPQPTTPGRFGQETAASNLLKSAVEVDSSDPVNVNVITFITTITSNVKHVAAFCCHALGEPLSKQPIYLKLFRECEYDAQAIAAALLFTLVHRRDGTMRNPAAVFVARCRDYHSQGVPDEAAALVKQYGSLTYTQLVDALHKPGAYTAPQESQRITPEAAPAPLRDRPLSKVVWSTPTFALDPALKVETERVVMNKSEAQALVQAIIQHERTKLFHVKRARVGAAQGCYVVVVDASIPGGPLHQTIVYCARDWQSRLAGMKTWRDLFVPFPSSVPAHVTKQERN